MDRYINKIKHAPLRFLIIWLLVVFFSVCCAFAFSILIIFADYILSLLTGGDFIAHHLSWGCKSIGGDASAGVICIGYKYMYSVFHSWYWPVTLIPVVVVVMGIKWIREK